MRETGREEGKRGKNGRKVVGNQEIFFTIEFRKFFLWSRYKPFVGNVSANVSPQAESCLIVLTVSFVY